MCFFSRLLTNCSGSTQTFQTVTLASYNAGMSFKSWKILWRQHELMKRRAALCRCQVLCGRAAEAGGGPKHLHDEWKLAKQIHIPSRMHMLEKLIDKRLIHSRTAHSQCRSFQKPMIVSPNALHLTHELLFAQFSDMHPRTARLGELYIWVQLPR